MKILPANGNVAPWPCEDYSQKTYNNAYLVRLFCGVSAMYYEHKTSRMGNDEYIALNRCFMLMCKDISHMEKLYSEWIKYFDALPFSHAEQWNQLRKSGQLSDESVERMIMLGLGCMLDQYRKKKQEGGASDGQ